MVCKELGLSDQTLRNWVKAAAEGKLSGAGNRVVTPEEMEFSSQKLHANGAESGLDIGHDLPVDG